MRITVHDDGFGVDRHKLADARTALRGAYGDDFDMVVQAEPGNTKVTVRVPR